MFEEEIRQDYEKIDWLRSENRRLYEKINDYRGSMNTANEKQQQLTGLRSEVLSIAKSMLPLSKNSSMLQEFYSGLEAILGGKNASETVNSLTDAHDKAQREIWSAEDQIRQNDNQIAQLENNIMELQIRQREAAQ